MENNAQTTFQFDLVSPEKKLLSQDVTMAVVPGEDGDLGVLAGHSPVVSTVRVGVVSIFENGLKDTPVHYFVDGGFVDVSEKGCTVLAEYATPLADLNASDLFDDISSLTERLSLIGEGEEKDVVAKELALRTGMLDAVKAIV